MASKAVHDAGAGARARPGGDGANSDDALAPARKKLCGMTPDILVIFVHAVVLGIDYTIILSASAQYYMHLLAGMNNATAVDMGDPTADHSLNVTTLNASDDSFCDPGSSEGDSLYAQQQTYWAIAQLIGCIAGIFLPKLINYKGSYLLFTALIAAGNLLYAVSTAQILDVWQLAMAGRIISGLGDGSIVLGLSYIPLVIKHVPTMRTALVNYRMSVAIGTTIGSLVSIGASRLSDPSKLFLDDEFSFNPANFAGFLMALLCVVLFIAEAIVIAPFTPPTKKGAVASPHWSWKILAWLFFVFTYGMLMGGVQYVVVVAAEPSRAESSPSRYAAAIFCFYADNSADLQTTQAVVLTVSFGFALGGAITSSVVTGAGCAKKLPKDVNLKLVQFLTLVIIFGLAFIYAGEKLQGSPSSIEVTAVMIFGNLVFFFAVTALSAAKSPLFKKIVPRSAISATMPLYKISLDLGKAVGPFWTEASMGAGLVDTAFAPFVLLFVVISVFLFTRGKWMTTPDTPEEAFCHKPAEKERASSLITTEGEFDLAGGGGQTNKAGTKAAAVTRGYAGHDEFEEEDPDEERHFVQLTDVSMTEAEKEAARKDNGYQGVSL